MRRRSILLESSIRWELLGCLQDVRFQHLKIFDFSDYFKNEVSWTYNIFADHSGSDWSFLAMWFMSSNFFWTFRAPSTNVLIVCKFWDVEGTVIRKAIWCMRTESDGILFILAWEKAALWAQSRDCSWFIPVILYVNMWTRFSRMFNMVECRVPKYAPASLRELEGCRQR